jgi:hypothetical protein
MVADTPLSIEKVEGRPVGSLAKSPQFAVGH